MKPTDERRVRSQSLTIDGLSLSLIMARTSLARARTAAAALESASADTRLSLAVELVTSAWTFIDALDRVRKLLEGLPGLRQQHPAVRLFRDRTVGAKDLRNYVQHLRNQIHQLPVGSAPVWGTLSWVSSSSAQRVCTLHIGSNHATTSSRSIAFDRFAGRFAQQFLLETEEGAIDLVQAGAALDELEQHLTEWASSAGYKVGEPEVLVFQAEFQRKGG